MNPLTQIVVQELRQRVNELYGDRLDRIVLFGSQSRGDAVSGSDIDVMVVLKGEVMPRKEIARAGGVTSELSLKYDVVISCTFISAGRYETEKSPLLMNVHREGVLV